MSATLKIRKGDTVQVISGKDRGKRGKVLEARPADRRVVIENVNMAKQHRRPRERKLIVENLNLVKRHQKPRPIRDASRMGGTQMAPGGRIEKPAAVPVANVMVVCPTCNRPTRIGIASKEVKGEQVHVRVCKRADCGQEIDK